MRKRLVFCCVLLCLGMLARAQKNKPPVDSTAYYDELFSSLDDFLDSLLAPRTVVLVNVGVSNTFLNYTANSYDVQTRRALSLLPSVGYFHKGGLGVNLSAMAVMDSGRLNAYQLLATASYDYLKKDAFLTGVSFTRFFTKKDLPFYTSPLDNEISAYFTYRRWWLKPSVVSRYGWGSRSAVAQREEQITSLRLRPYGFTRINTTENIADFSIAASVRHDFYWLDILGAKSVLRVTPQLSFASGTQKFGLNEFSDTYVTPQGSNSALLYKSEDNYLDGQLYFQPISAAAYLKTELSFGRFFVQPQVSASYYFPATEKHFTTSVQVNTGFIF
ncbi:MAG: hypothetical protein JWP27_585 [Flaviaesturariibacter sp.]|nr:hypothetical protein [Flaviaesturariibacter sp.]